MTLTDGATASDARVLVTGATGLVGAAVRVALEEHGWTSVTGVSRHGAPGARVVAWNIGAEAPPPALRRVDWNVVINAAADTRWTQQPGEALRANVASVEALSELVSPTTHVVHVSTAYAIGRGACGSPAALEHYRNAYEWSKAQAEQRARELFPSLTIVRPPLIIGRRTDGRAARFSGMYTLLRGVALSSVPAVVAVPDAYFDVIPVDDLATLIVRVAATRDHAGGDVITLAGGDEALSVESALQLILDAFNTWREARALDLLAAPRLVSPESWSRFLLPFARDHLSARQQQIIHLLSNFQPYLTLTEPLRCTHRVRDVEGCLRASVRYWADANERVASLSPQPWTAAP
jgi:nucleoside-diphosphate-sugar epimerase